MHFRSRVVGARLLLEGEVPYGVEAENFLAALEIGRLSFPCARIYPLRPPSSGDSWELERSGDVSEETLAATRQRHLHTHRYNTMAAAVHTVFVPLISVQLTVLTATCISVGTEPHRTQALVGEAQRSRGGAGEDRMQGLQDSVTSQGARKSLASEIETNNSKREAALSAHADVDEADNPIR